MFSSANRRILPLLLVLAALGVVLPACGSSEEEVEGSGYTVELPDDWDDRTDDAEEQGGVIRFDAVLIGPRVQGFASNVNILRERRPRNASLEEIEQQGRPQLRAVGASDISQAKAAELDGERAFSRGYRIRQERQTRRGEQYVAVRDDSVYHVTFTSTPGAFADVRKDFEEILDSWKWD